jgi:hypothetical protein
MRNRVNLIQDAGEACLVNCTDKAMAQLIANDFRLKDLCMTAGGRYLVVPRETETGSEGNYEIWGTFLIFKQAMESSEILTIHDALIHRLFPNSLGKSPPGAVNGLINPRR